MVHKDEAQVNGCILTRCTERDVLLGRGKRVSNWPGNIYFRQIVNKYRDAYNKAGRNHKNMVADLVRQQISANGGRFLHEVENSAKSTATEVADSWWTEVDYSRSVEKSCQALRERIKSQTRDSSQFLGDHGFAKLREKQRWNKMRREMTKSRGHSAEKGKATCLQDKQIEQQQQQNIKMSRLLDNNSARVTLSSDAGSGIKVPRLPLRTSSSCTSSRSSSSSFGNDKGAIDACLAFIRDSNTLQRIKVPITPRNNAICDKMLTTDVTASKQRLQGRSNEMMEKLIAFQTSHGHTAVPPNWSHDVILADWCTVQRRLYREIETGFRRENDCDVKQMKTAEYLYIIAPHEQKILNALRAIKFCWNYDEWHWNYRYKQLKDAFHRSTENERENAEIMLWVYEQRQEHMEGRLTSKQIKQLIIAGVDLQTNILVGRPTDHP